MKKIAVLALLATPAFGGTSKFEDRVFLSIAGGDSSAAQDLYYYCSTSRIANCAQSLAGNGNLKVEAARRCAQKNRAILFGFNPNLSEIYKRAGISGGMTYRTGKPHKDESGTHFHVYTDDDNERAVRNYRATLYLAALAVAEGKRGSKEVTSGGKVEGGVNVDAKVLGAGVGVSFSPGSHVDTTEIKAKLTPEEIAAIEKEAKTAVDDPFLKGGVVPSQLCLVWEKFCTIGANKQVPNPYYDPKAKDDSKAAEESSDKKGAENPRWPRDRSSG